MSTENKNPSIFIATILTAMLLPSLAFAQTTQNGAAAVQNDATTLTSPAAANGAAIASNVAATNDPARINMPTQEDVSTINKDLKIMLNGMFSGDVEVFMEKTNPKLFPLLGGKENFSKFTQEALSQLDLMGVKIISTEHQIPGRFYAAGNNMLTIVPRTTVMEIEGQRLKTTGFMVAIKNTETNSWTYLDGSGLREDRSMLWKMFPELTADIQFPENKIEKIEPIKE